MLFPHYSYIILAVEIAGIRAAAESALTSKSSSSKLVYHSEGGSSFDLGVIYYSISI